MGLSRPFTAAVLLAAAALPVRAQERALDGVRVQVDASGDAGGARVTARYRIRAQPGDTVTLTAVPFFGLRIADALADGVPVRIDDTHLRVATGGGELELRYTVPQGAIRRGAVIDVRVPVPLPQGFAVGSAEDFFHAELAAPSGLHVVESFPTVPLEGATHAMTLPVAPGLLRWRLVEGDAPRLTFAGIVDTGVLFVLLVLAVLGVRGLRRTAEDG